MKTFSPTPKERAEIIDNVASAIKTMPEGSKTEISLHSCGVFEMAIVHDKATFDSDTLTGYLVAQILQSYYKDQLMYGGLFHDFTNEKPKCILCRDSGNYDYVLIIHDGKESLYNITDDGVVADLIMGDDFELSVIDSATPLESEGALPMIPDRYAKPHSSNYELVSEDCDGNEIAPKYYLK